MLDNAGAMATTTSETTSDPEMPPDGSPDEHAPVADAVPPRRRRFSVASIALVAMAVGLVVLLFVGWTLWGTSLTAARAQDDLESQFAEAEELAAQPVGGDELEVAGAEVERVSDIPEAERAARAPLPPYPEEGALVARIEIPSIGVNWLVSEGVSLDILRDGPGHFSGTPRPGEEGNAIIAGHRTTYGAPFNRLDELRPGDEIHITYLTGRQFTYDYRETKIVAPSDTSVLQDFGDNRLTLTACHPEYSAAERIVVVAALDDGQTAEPISDAVLERRGGVESLESLDGAAEGDHLPAYLWGAAAIATVVAVVVLAVCWKRLPALLLGVPLCLLVLAVAFENIARRLPTAF